ncbi:MULTISPECIES: energy transducer TonB [Pseudomonas syringae group]|uniref:Protein TonB n=3 Tax=Pseudomonas syringae group TaxID=136849 RepID=A0AAD0DXP0_9PSED|nr:MULTISPECIES: energy transducer TonB [Pseudomonas syringae group]AVB18520.1 energy transducer TonB [Pseudomonas avellanae]KWS70789.1 energy transducer TonB [Pseudomonas amygdali pv. morsprunorum]POC84396.1 energy transducer TonB [Pseudomonas avellanae]POP81760.1 energy transducer TonB [Pseudomonas amygdali pv. morsprunorum]SOS32030.1 cell envelope biogenesis protein TonB [Pseudomonas syringae group genomosp. 3]
MSTLILPRRLPPRQLRHWPEQPNGGCSVAPSALLVVQQNPAQPRAWPHNALAIMVALGLHAALAYWLTTDPTQAPEPTPPVPITVQWGVPPAPVPVPQPVSQPTPQPAAEPQQQAPVPAAPKPTELPKPKTQAKTVAAKPVAPTHSVAPSTAPSTAPTTPAPATAPSPAAAPAPAQTTTAPIGRAGYLNNPPPVYPPAAARRHKEGTTLLRVHVLPSGRTDQVQVLQSSGVPALDEAAQAAVRQWTFIPAKRGDTPVEGWVNVPLAFKLAP